MPPDDRTPKAKRGGGPNYQCLVFDREGIVFVDLMGTIQIANAGRLWIIGGAAQLVN
jgi:hypothetical protein